MNLKEKLNKYLDSYLNKSEENFVGSFKKARTFFSEEKAAPILYDYADINDFIDINKDENTFQTKLFEHIDNKNLKDSDVYNKVNIDRRLFSKIRSDKNYHPSKETVILLGIALELTEKEIEDLLEKASYSLPKNTTYDLIIRFCFKEKIYNINQINEFLYDHNCKTLN
ncbi:MAG: hypothetical protein IKG27_00345 [Bacilli bacterium]|nr:hypothetical protein [Bacilli bacterium]